MYDTSSSKLRKMVEIIANLPPETKCIVFSQWAALLQVIQNRALALIPSTDASTDASILSDFSLVIVAAPSRQRWKF
jgi:hypothetical protein